MILVKAPLRLSFLGGGSDIPRHFEEHGGATLSVAFNKYVHAAVAYTPTDHIKVSYSATNYFTDVNQINHDIIREVLKTYHVTKNIEVTSFADIPTVGTGLGASSAFAVALVRAMETIESKYQFEETSLAQIAAYIETEKVGAPIGYQDHYSAALGGFNFIEYGPVIRHRKVKADSELERCMFLIKVAARTISANELLTPKMDPKAINDLAQLAREAASYSNLTGRNLGSLLTHAWEIKQQLHPQMTTPEIDEIYTSAMSNGCVGGKLLGAGNGGYLLMCTAYPSQTTYAREKLNALSLKTYEVKFETKGAHVAYDSRL